MHYLLNNLAPAPWLEPGQQLSTRLRRLYDSDMRYPDLLDAADIIDAYQTLCLGAKVLEWLQEIHAVVARMRGN